MNMNKHITEEMLIEIIEDELRNTDKNLILAIDGRCASGKTSLGKRLSEHFGANLFHADDFFLRPEQRSAERLEKPGGNFDIERFAEELINGINSGNSFSYRPFNCKTMSLSDEIHITKNKLNIIEGSYSCHPDIVRNYDITVFVTTDKEIQKERIIQRNKEKAPMFFEKWIPLEEKYFSYFGIENRCDYIINT